MAIEVESSVKITIGNQVVTLSGSEARELYSQLGRMFGLTVHPIKYPLYEYWDIGKGWPSVPSTTDRITCTAGNGAGKADYATWSST